MVTVPPRLRAHNTPLLSPLAGAAVHLVAAASAPTTLGQQMAPATSPLAGVAASGHLPWQFAVVRPPPAS